MSTNDEAETISDAMERTWKNQELPALERAPALLFCLIRAKVKLETATDFLEKHYPPHTRQIIIMTALKERLQHIAKEREKAYNEYAKTRNLAATDTRISRLSRMEKEIKDEYRNVLVYSIASFVTANDIQVIKKIGFTKFMISPAVFLSTYENSISVKGNGSITV